LKQFFVESAHIFLKSFAQSIAMVFLRQILSVCANIEGPKLPAELWEWTEIAGENA